MTTKKPRKRDAKGRYIKSDGTSKATRSAKRAPKGIVSPRGPVRSRNTVTAARKSDPSLRTRVRRGAKKVSKLLGKARMGAGAMLGGRLR